MMAKQRSSAPDWLFRTLQQAGLRVESGSTPESLIVRLQGSKPIEFHVLAFPVLSLERAQEVVRSALVLNPKARSLLAIRQLSERTREMLRTSGCSWAEELSGIVHIVAPGLLVNLNAISISERQPESAVRARLRDRSGLLAEALLISSPKDKIALGAIARRAHVSNALASRVLTRLSKINLIEVHGAGPNRFWRLADRGGLLDLWAAEEKQRPEKSHGLYVWSRSPQGLFEKLPSLNHLTQAWALGGAAAANAYAPTLTTYPDPIIWIDARIPPEEVARALQGEIADKGANIQLWQSERNLPLELVSKLSNKRGSPLHGQELRLVSKPRAYIETVRAAGRAPEIAQNLRERILSGNESD
jgi:hypothetical protein